MNQIRSQLVWKRRFPQSNNNFDLVLNNPESVDSERISRLLEAISEETHRGLTLSSRATRELKRWLKEPSSPLRSDAYVLLSNWFLTQSGDRSSGVATRCEGLWDALFACRPVERLSSPEPGRNHIMVGSEFESFWRRLQQAQGEKNSLEVVSQAIDSKERDADETQESLRLPRTVGPAVEKIRAVFTRGDLNVQLEGTPEAVAEFFRRV